MAEPTRPTVPLTVEAIVKMADRGRRGEKVPYGQLLTALEVATGRTREVCDAAIVGAALAGYLEVDGPDEPFETRYARTTEAGRSLVPDAPTPAARFPRPNDLLASLDPALNAVAEGLTDALHLVVAAELRLWAAGLRGLADGFREGLERPDDEPDHRELGDAYRALAGRMVRRADGLDVPVVPRVEDSPTAWVPGDPVHRREPGRGHCADAACGATWVPGGTEACPECGGPASDDGLAAREVASYLAHSVRLRPSQEADLRAAFQRMIDEGRFVGRVLTGDHDEDGVTVRDWTEVGQ